MKLESIFTTGGGEGKEKEEEEEEKKKEDEGLAASIMAQKNVPRLVVKIVGSKQVKQFIQENSPVDGIKDEFKNPLDVMEEMREDSSVWAAITQAPGRLCVTAPSGDRSRSYIHPKTPRRAAAEAGASEAGDKAELSSAVRDELCEWQLSSLTSTEDEASALDTSLSGKLDRSQVTHLFLKSHVPLTLPTFSLLLQTFTDQNDPEQIHYKNLLEFVRASLFPEELQRRE
ncbi:uncharacterized protein C1orf87 isoform X2 [Mugil cephalus]|uniref:uncharacterized protein C1orf87 isoform X2 n=1 Tax=Mugil cephalus TaxID=48193 RepID=UPI001FB5A416|nr:uncharacterized protein C1orf87 isoform X2 [Mugil cephalus]